MNNTTFKGNLCACHLSEILCTEDKWCTENDKEKILSAFKFCKFEKDDTIDHIKNKISTCTGRNCIVIKDCIEWGHNVDSNYNHSTWLYKGNSYVIVFIA